MDKKTEMLQIIQSFENNAGTLPNQLKTKLQTIKTQLNSVSSEEIASLSDGVVSSDEVGSHHEDPYHMLYEAYSEMEKYAYTGERKPELHHVIQQMRGLYGIPDRYFP